MNEDMDLIKLVEDHPRVKVNKIRVGCLMAGEFSDDVRGQFNVFEISKDERGRNRLIYTHDDVVELHSIESLREALIDQKIPRHYKQSYTKKEV
jgi:hypothetical protein